MPPILLPSISASLKAAVSLVVAVEGFLSTPNIVRFWQILSTTGCVVDDVLLSVAPFFSVKSTVGLASVPTGPPPQLGLPAPALSNGVSETPSPADEDGIDVERPDGVLGAVLAAVLASSSTCNSQRSRKKTL
jgi:hypothetical protein